MSDTTTADQILPPSLQPGYQPPLPVSLQPPPRSPLYQLAGAPAAPSEQPSSPEPRNYTVTGTGPGTWWSRQQQPPGQWRDRPDVQQQPQPPAPQPQPSSPVALNRPPAFQQGHQPGPWPAAHPNSPRFDPAQAPPLPGETPQETADLNKFMAHETGNRGNIINDWAARDPSRYYQGQTCQGYWQITNSTWRDGAQRAGVDLRQYPTAMTAPYPVQRAVALALYRSYGGRPWAVPPGAGERGDRFALRPQQPPPAEPRDYRSWGQDVRDDASLTSAPPRDFGPGPSSQGGLGQPPQESGWVRALNGVGPLLVGIASLALRLPLSTAITAAGAMARAQDNGQREAYERARTRMQDQAKEANAQQTLESREASDAFVEYGNNNPAGLQQTLAQIALKYNDPIMYRMAERGDLNGIHQLQQRRDLYNQDLTRANKAAQDEQDREEQNRTVAAMDAKWRRENPNASEEDFQIAHNQHIGEARRQFTGTREPGTGVETPVYDVVDRDTGKVTRQVQRDKNGHLLDMNDQPTTIDPNKESLRPVSARSEKPEQEGEVRDVLDKDGNRIRQVREGKTGGLFDLNGNPTTIDEKNGETLAQPSRGAGGRDPTEGDYTWTNPDGSRGEGYAKIKGKQLVDGVTEEPIPTKPGTPVNKISTQSAAQAGAGARGTPGQIEDWEGMNEGRPPPGVSNADWVQAQDWARLGRAPPGLSSRSGAYQGAHDALPYALHALGKSGADMPRDAIDYETQRTASTSTERYFTSGMGARQLTALDTVAAHIGLFREYAAAVKSGNITAINEVAGRLATATGSPELIDMGIAATITGDEVIRLLTQTGGSRGDREDIKQKLSVYSSPEQFEGIANTLTNFVRERYDPLRQQYTNRIGATEADKARYEEAFKNKITPAARAIIEQKQPIAGGAQVQPMTEQQYNSAPSGARYRLPSDPPDMVRVKP